MTDQEIIAACKRFRGPRGSVIYADPYSPHEFNPLTSWADAGALLAKAAKMGIGVRIIAGADAIWCAQVGNRGEIGECPNRAIATACARWQVEKEAQDG